MSTIVKSSFRTKTGRSRNLRRSSLFQLPGKIRFETVAAFLLVSLVVLFFSDIRHFFKTGDWMQHSGAASFGKWLTPKSIDAYISVHGAGMLIWMGVVQYQLRTQGNGMHKAVGYTGAVLVFFTLLLTFPAARYTAVPSIHGLCGFTLVDAVLFLTVVGILEETLVGILKARARALNEHRRHLLTATLFTAAPGLYRLFVRIGLFLPGVIRPESQDFDTALLHETSICLATGISSCILVSPSFSGHSHAIKALKLHREPPAWTVIVARVMLTLGALFISFFSVWVLDNIIYHVRGDFPPDMFMREDAPVFNLISFPLFLKK